VKRFVRPLLLVTFIAAVTIVARRLQLHDHVSVAGMRALIERTQPYGPLVFMAAAIAGLFLHMPEIVFIAIGGVLFGKAQGFLYGWLAAVVGASATFLLGRYFFRHSVQQAMDGRFARLRALDERLVRHGFRTIVLLRLLIFLAPPLNWAIGASRVRFMHYLAGTAVGIVPGVATTVYFADTIADRGGTAHVLTPDVVIPGLLIGAFLLAGVIAARRMLRA
jgi:uncharacterized membrane protein YdjX (TVP38/TMEM64 family)